MQRSPQNPQDYSPRSTYPGVNQSLVPAAKTVYFYKDGDYNYGGIKLAVNPRRFRNFDSLLDELSSKIPQMSYGVRSVYTPGGSNHISSIDSLHDEGRYICSTYSHKAKGIDIKRVGPRRPWVAGRPPTARKRLNALLRGSNRERIQPVRRPLAPITSDGDSSINSRIQKPKKITVVKNGEPTIRHTVLLNRRTAQSFEQILDDMSGMFYMAVKRMWTVDGRSVKSLSGIFNGPESYVVGGTERFRPLPAFFYEGGDAPRPRRHRKLNPNDGVAARIREKRDKMSRTRGRWRVWVTTDELPSSGTTAQVTLTVYGHRSNTDPIPLGYRDGSAMQAGGIDEFEISIGNIGEIYKVRVAHDNTGEFPGWYCDEIRMIDQHTDEELTFACNRWLSRDEEDGEICRELPAVREREPVLPILKYEITVVTGDLWSAGSEANVYMTIYGERGDTGVRLLHKNKNGKGHKFQKGQVDTFTLEAVSLGQLRRCIIGHDGTGPGNGWFLEKIIVKESPRAQEEYVFPCGRWLDEGEEDGKIVRELRLQEEWRQDLVEKELWEYEKWKFDQFNQVLLFSKATQKAIRIKLDASVDGLGEVDDKTAIFSVLPRRGMVRVFQNVASPRFHLAIDSNRVLGQGRGGAYCEFRVRIQPDRSLMLESLKHPTMYVTLMQNGLPGDVRGSSGSPNKQFYAYCKGMFRASGIVMFCTSATQTLNISHDNTIYGTGKRNRIAHFRVHKVAEGNIRMFESIVFPRQYLRMKDGLCDCLGIRDMYSQFKVIKYKEKGYVALESVANKGVFIGMTPDGKVRPTVDTGEKNVRLYPEVIQFGRQKVVTSSDPEPTPPPINTKPRKVRKRRTPSPKLHSPAPKSESSEEHFEDGDWTVWITSLEAAHNAVVGMVVYGDKGNSGPILLGRSGENGLFEKSNSDKFKVNLHHVGKIYKIRVELNPVDKKQEPPSWKIKEVKMQDMNTKETLKFKMNRWLSRHHDDGDIMREMPAVRPGQPVLQVFNYQILVFTGTEPGADTDANVCIIMYGERGDTGQRLLHRSNNGQNRFQEGQLDVFELEAVDLGKIKRCVVSHDGRGAGEGWYCQQVSVRESDDATHEFVFPCDRWLDTSLDDKKIERVLKVKEPAPCPIETEERPIEAPPPAPDDEKFEDGDWKVWVTTGRDRNMATSNEVTLYVYGDKDVGPPYILGVGKDLFNEATTDSFKINIKDNVGHPYKIRIGHNDEDPTSGWYLEKVKMKNMTTNELLTFKVNRWLSRHEDDCDVWREFPVIRPGKAPLPVITYTIEVYTGDLPGADTDASIYIQMFGTRGDSGKRQLYKSKTKNTSPFQQGQTDTFELEAVSLNDITKVIVGHNGKGHGAGWYLDKIMIRESDDHPYAKSFYFPCERWLDEGQDDGKIEREIEGQEPPKVSHGRYLVSIYTAKDSRPAHGSKVIFTMYGEKGKSDGIELFSPFGNNAGLYDPGNKDEFEVTSGDIGELYKIRVERQFNDTWEGWHLDKVTLKDLDTNELMMFKCNQWLDFTAEEHDIVKEMPVIRNGKEVVPKQQYELMVVTGDRWAADTDANVYIRMHGKRGDSGQRYLVHSYNNANKFQKNQTDMFVLGAVSLDELSKIEVGHDGVGYGAGWFLERIIVREKIGDNTKNEYVFPCSRWLDDHEDDKKTKRTLKMLDCQDVDAEPKIADKNTKTQGTWTVVVKTSDIHNAGTHAQVYITVYGEKGNSGPQKLGSANQSDDSFDKGKKSDFKISVGDIGEVYKIRVEHDEQNSFPDWHLEKLSMTDQDTGEELTFYVDRWFARDQEDGAVCRELPASRPGQSPLPVHNYYVSIHTGNVKEAGTSADVTFNLYGERGDTGKRKVVSTINTDTKWQQGQVDVFTIEAVHLGKLTKVEIEHDGKDKASSWFIDKVVVKETENAISEFVFPYENWLEGSAKEITMSGEQVSIRDKEDSSEPVSRGTWTVWLTAGVRAEGAEKALVSLVVCGTQGCTEPILLYNESRKQRGALPRPTAFRPGSTHHFDITVDNVGEFVKVRLTLDDSEPNQRLNLLKMKMKDKTTKQEFHFHYDGWLVQRGAAEEGRDTLEMAAVRPDIPPPQALDYVVNVTTGNKMRAETSPTVFCTLIGEFGDTGRRPLLTQNSFKKGQDDTFTISALDLGKISSILIGHTNRGRGLGWYCEKVTIKTSAAALTETIFPSFRWLDTGCNNRYLDTELRPIADIPVVIDDKSETEEKLVSKGEWKVTVTLTGAAEKLKESESSSSGQSGPLSITVYGRQSVFGPHEIDIQQTDQLKEFDLDLSKVGEIYKIRMCQGSDLSPGVWTVQQVTMFDEHTKEQLLFDFRRWLGENVEDIRKELPAIRPNKPLIPVIQYEVKIFTGEKASDANDKTNKDTKPAHQEAESNDEKMDIYVTIYGNRGDTGIRHLVRRKEKKDLFLPGQEDTFILDAVHLGTVEKVVLTKHGMKDWYVEKVIVKEGEFAATQHIFSYNGLITNKKPVDTENVPEAQEETAEEVTLNADNTAEVEIRLTKTQLSHVAVPLQMAPHVKPSDGSWTVYTTTGSERNAGATSQPVLVLCGDRGESTPIPLGAYQRNKLQPRQTDVFDIMVEERVGDIFKVRVGFEDNRRAASWKLSTIKLKDKTNGDEFSCDFNGWMEVNDALDGWREFTAVWPAIKILPVLNYHVEVYTADRQRAGTDSNVYITIFGEKGNTGRRQLKKSNNNNKFKQGQVDIFEIEAVSVMDLQRVVVGHNAKAPGDGWFLDKIIIKEAPTADKEFIFECDRWLDTGEDDTKIERELLVTESPSLKSEGDPWKVWTLTDEQQHAGTKSQVVLSVYGENGKSDDIPLTSDKDKLFQMGQLDEFEIRVKPDLGKVYKIRLGYTPETQTEPSWYIDNVKLENQKTGEQYEFPADRWVKITNDQDGYVEIPVKDQTQPLLPVYKYIVGVYTADILLAGTDANVYMTIYGERGDTGKRKLLKSLTNDNNKFEQGSLDVFEIEAVDLKNLTKVVIGHDGFGHGAGWFLDRVVIKATPEAEEFEFECNRWLDEGEDDGALERELLVSKGDDWKVTVVTDTDEKSGTEAELLITIYGEKGRSEDLILKSDQGNKLLPGSTEQFDVKVKAKVGDVYKVRLGYAPETSGGQAWMLKNLKLVNETQSKEYEFHQESALCLLRDDDNEGWVELSVKKDERKDILPVLKYTVNVDTGDLSNAGTDASVYLTLFGERGDTGKRKLLRSLTHDSNKFEQGRTDQFEIKAVELLDLTRVVVGHDGQGAGSGWFLDKIVVMVTEPPLDGSTEKGIEKKYKFPCNRWLDKDEDDKKTERELLVKKGDPWKIWTLTGGEKSEEPTEEVTLVLYGDKGMADPVRIAGSEGFTFTANHSDDFDVLVSEEVGELYKVRIGFHEPKGKLEWFLEKIKLRDETSQKEYEYELNAWIRVTDENDGWREIPFNKEDNEDEDQSTKDKVTVLQYQVEVTTGDQSGAGTDANVYIHVYGERGDTGQRKLLHATNNSNKFESGQTDLFEIEAVDMKKLEKVVIGHDGKGAGAGWFLDKVLIKETADAKRQFLFKCDKWLDEGEDDNKIERELKLTEIIDDDVKDGDWRVFVTTGSQDNCGTDAQVALTVFGEKGDTDKLPLGAPEQGLFENGSTDQFDIYIEPSDVGKVKKIRLEHDNSKPFSGWFVEKVVMEDLYNKKELVFSVKRWLDDDEDDGDIVRELPAEWPGEKPLEVTKYIVQTVTGKEFGGGSDANIYITIFGEKGDTGKRFLSKSKEGKDKFEKGKTDTFSLEAIDLGDLKKVVIGHDQEGSGSGWYLDKVIVKEAQDATEKFVFKCDQWLDKDEGDGKTERELPAEKVGAKGGKDKK